MSSSVDSSTCRSGFPPAVKSLIDSLMVFFFSTLELLASPPLLAFVTPDVVKHTVRALQELLPFGECVVSEWGRVLMQCGGTSDEQVQIEILKAVRVLAGLINDEKGEDYRFIADEVVDILVGSYSLAPSLSHWFQRQEESVVLIRTLLQRPCFRTYLHAHVLSLLTSPSQARQLAGVAICGGELIGLYEGCQAVFTPRVCEVNEKNCGSDLYEGKKPCVVLELLPERDVVSVVLAGEQEKKEVTEATAKKPFKLLSMREAGIGGYSCGRVCGKVLACQRHRCDRVCHPGDCGVCPFTVTAVALAARPDA